MTDDLIDSYRIKLTEPGCAPGSGRWGVEVNLRRDISEVFPYLNAVFGNTIYDRENNILIIREKNQVYAFRPEEIQIARSDDTETARREAEDIVGRVNDVWRKRGAITPVFSDKKRVNVIDIFKQLPQKNCRKCGYLTCLAYSADLRQGKSRVDDCPYMSQPEFARNRQKLDDLFASD